MNKSFSSRISYFEIFILLVLVSFLAYSYDQINIWATFLLSAIVSVYIFFVGVQYRFILTENNMELNTYFFGIRIFSKQTELELITTIVLKPKEKTIFIKLHRQQRWILMNFSFEEIVPELEKIAEKYEVTIQKLDYGKYIKKMLDL